MLTLFSSTHLALDISGQTNICRREWERYCILMKDYENIFIKTQAWIMCNKTWHVYLGTKYVWGKSWFHVIFKLMNLLYFIEISLAVPKLLCGCITALPQHNNILPIYKVQQEAPMGITLKLNLKCEIFHLYSCGCLQVNNSYLISIMRHDNE